MQQLADHLISKQKQLQSQSATLGFDGFVDTIVKLVKRKENNNQPAAYFTSMADWGHYILDKKAGNFSAELQQCNIKSGGNMPNMATALANLGLPVNCVGALGYPHIDPLFTQMPANCRLFSFAPPGSCQAIEFDDGKIMLAGMDELNKADWNTLKKRIPVAELIKIVDAAGLIGLLNWGELTSSTSFWKGLLQEVLPFCSNTNKIFFVDLSDCSSRTKPDIMEALELLSQFAAYGKCILGLNRNESIFVHQTLFADAAVPGNLKILGERIFSRLQPAILLLHNREKAMAFQKDEIVEKNSCIIEQPVILTGAGDNFNAGFCFAQLMNCNLQDSLQIAHLAAALYIKNGKSASWNILIEALIKI